ncbi:hypothetical protein DL96DRAFT_1613492 [Flagelloscypha sp. PMI_526]|nr:hypothetical protein DL96DRAFT_1613492 [Flagelloscypha sp. PMI_526]
MEESDGKLLLSLDAGWLESPNIISQLYVIDDVLHMYEFDKELPDNSVRAYEVFDMIIGTGSGGLLAVMLGPLKMTTREALSAFHTFHQSVFTSHGSSTLADSGLDPTPTPQVLGERLLSAIQHLLEQCLGDKGLLLKLKDIEKLIPGCKFAVTAMTSAHLASPTVFRGYRSRKSSPDATLFDALRATLANARLFPPVTFGTPIPSTYIGADSGHPNPIETIVQEAGSMFRNKSIATILSIGSGRHETIAVDSPGDYPEAMVKLISSAQTESERAISRFSHHSEAYYRFEVDELPPHSASSQESVEPSSRAYLARENVNQQLNELVSLMCSRPSTIMVEELGRPKAGGLAKEVKHIPIVNSMYDNLKMLSYAERASFNPDLVCLEGTRRHILDLIFEWMVDQGAKPSVLWLEGAFGSGKSYIAHSVAVEADRRKILGSSFFMTPGTNTRDLADRGTTINEHASLKNIVTSLIVDLGGLSQRFRWAVGEILEQRPRLATAAPSIQLTELLFPYLPSLSHERIFLWVIDGFDELMRYTDRDAAEGFFNTLFASFHLFPSNFIIFITSRPLPNHPVPQISALRHLVLDLSSPENGHDLDIISYAELTRLAASNRAFSAPSAEHELSVAFRNKAGGHPLWLRVVREHLLSSLTPNEELQELLDLDGTGSSDYSQLMTSTYSQVIIRSIDLSNTKNRKTLRHVILILLALQRPLSLSVLLEILDGSDELPSTTFRAVTSHLRPLLLGFDSTEPLEFIHLSLRDFFASSPSFSELIQEVPAPRDLAPGHFTLLLCAFRVMEKHIPSEVSLEEYPRGHPPLAYVIASWPNHLINLTSKTYSSRLIAPLSHFFDGSFIAWLDYHPQIGLPFLFTEEFLEQAKPLSENIWDERILTSRRTVQKLDQIRQRFQELRCFNDWVLCSSLAVELWRTHAHSDPNDQPRLYTALNHKARGLDELGMHGDALAVSDEAVAICRSLTQPKIQQKHSYDLAEILTGLCKRLADAGRHTESLAAIDEALSIYRQLAQERPKVFDADLAGALTNISISLSSVGRRAESLSAIDEAISLYRLLDYEHQKVFQDSLALSLTISSNYLSDAGRHAESLAASEEAVSLYDQLVQERPDVFEAELAGSLINFSMRLTKVERHEESLAAIEESVSLFLHLAQERPNVFEADLALSLSNLSNRLSDAGEHSEALAVVEEAVALRRKLVQERPNVFEADLAISLTSFSGLLSNVGRHGESLAIIDEAVSMYRLLVQSRPNLFEADLSVSLHNFSNRLAYAGRHPEALTAVEEAVTLRRKLVQERPNVFEGKLARSLNSLAVRLSKAGRHAEALAAAQEAVSLYQQLAQEQPTIYQQRLENATARLTQLQL